MNSGTTLGAVLPRDRQERGSLSSTEAKAHIEHSHLREACLVLGVCFAVWKKPFFRRPPNQRWQPCGEHSRCLQLLGAPDPVLKLMLALFRFPSI